MSLPTLVFPPSPPSMIAKVAGCRRQWQPPAPSSLWPWFSTIATTFFSLGDVEREGKTGDDAGKVSVGFTEEGGRADGGYGRKKKRAISAQNMQPAQSA